jgi:hypothetical protein
MNFVASSDVPFTNHNRLNFDPLGEFVDGYLKDQMATREGGVNRSR